jgi:hypothetical protein
MQYRKATHDTGRKILKKLKENWAESFVPIDNNIRTKIKKLVKDFLKLYFAVALTHKNVLSW